MKTSFIAVIFYFLGVYFNPIFVDWLFIKKPKTDIQIIQADTIIYSADSIFYRVTFNKRPIIVEYNLSKIDSTIKPSQIFLQTYLK